MRQRKLLPMRMEMNLGREAQQFAADLARVGCNAAQIASSVKTFIVIDFGYWRHVDARQRQGSAFSVRGASLHGNFDTDAHTLQSVARRILDLADSNRIQPYPKAQSST